MLLGVIADDFTGATDLANTLVRQGMRVIEIPFLALQRLLGVNKLAWVFLAPNLILFGLFAFLPVILNVSYSVTGGDNVLLENRPDFLRHWLALNAAGASTPSVGAGPPASSAGSATVCTGAPGSPSQFTCTSVPA